MRASIGGTFHGVESPKRGDALKFSEVTGLAANAKRYVAQGLTSYRRIPMDELRPAYEQDEHDIAVTQELAREDRENFRRQHPELQPKPGGDAIIGSRYPSRLEGWSV
jgi:hypothetical protein